MNQLPAHLQKYIVQQDEAKYTPIDHAVWRFVLRSLKNFHSKHAHPAYTKGLEETGIEIDQIPSISHISKKLEKFGWRALPVSGFIPPAAFMELQALNVLPIASDMRTIDHLMYTPAPDIVHEAAGHAPLLSLPEYAGYLRQYAQVAKKAILSQEDLNLYEAIRLLSDLKENPNSTPEQIQSAEKNLDKLSQDITYVSEASQLGRMNWWTAEYGLIGTPEDPKIFGAGLLSSVGESRWCLSEKVKRFPLTVSCVEQGYDITEPQPQLFVTPSFEHLTKVLEEFSETMAYKQGGVYGLEKAVNSKTVNTVQYNSGVQVSGVLQSYLTDKNGNAAYLQFKGPTQISFNDKELAGHSKKYHAEGFGSPVGYLASLPSKCISEFSKADWEALGIQWMGDTLEKPVQINWQWENKIELKGKLQSRRTANGKTVVLTFTNCKVTMGDKVLFDPAWGNYDMTIGCEITSVFGGAADRIAYGEMSDFVAARIPAPTYTPEQKVLHSLYQTVRDLRNSGSNSEESLRKILNEVQKKFPNDWLLTLEILEIALKKGITLLQKDALQFLETHQKKNPPFNDVIEEGITLARKG